MFYMYRYIHVCGSWTETEELKLLSSLVTGIRCANPLSMYALTGFLLMKRNETINSSDLRDRIE